MTKEERKAYMKAWYAAHPGYNAKRVMESKKLHPETRIKWENENPEYYKKWAERYKEKNPEKKIAHSLVTNAIKHGKLKRSPCEVCGDNRKYHVHAHHDDYSKPLEVRWLCVIHHKAIHK